VVERNLAKVEVASSTLVSRSNFSFQPGDPRRWTFSVRNANVLCRGAVPKW
jgi:hypothetical protein